jgi:hypothetical protein
MGHDTYDTQQSLYYVNVYIIHYLIFSTYSKIARENLIPTSKLVSISWNK